jgi:hypothetical protein
MMDDDFDDLLRDASASYNLPPEPPREAMWEAISRARNAAPGTPVTPLFPARRTPRWLATAAGIAAVLMVGVVIGRTTSNPALAPQPTVATTDVPKAAPLTAATESPVAAADTEATVAAGTAKPRTSGDRVPESSSAIAGRRYAAAQRVGARAAARADRDARADAGQDASYRLAVVQHLTRTELLLTSFRAKASSAEEIRADAQFASLARELLGTTRLLLATRRRDDPMITRLLEDLEYVLMQLSQYANEGRRTDLDAINQSLDKTNVIPKLRSNIPAGVPASSGT